MDGKDGEIDYSECSLSELRDVDAQIDARMYPKNYADLQHAIAEATASQATTVVAKTRQRYPSVWQRIGAAILDILIAAPALGIVIWLGGQSRVAGISAAAMSVLFNLWFYVYLVKRYGGTPGKLMLDLRITTIGYRSAGYKEAVLRYAVIFLLATVGQLALLEAAFEMTEVEYVALDWMERAARMQELAPGWFETITLLTNIWLISQLVVMLANEKRRAVHDFIAGTVVVTADSN